MQVGTTELVSTSSPQTLEEGHLTSPHANIDISRDPDSKHLLEEGPSSPSLNQEANNLRNIGMEGPPQVEYAVGVRSRDNCCAPATVICTPFTLR